MVRRHGQTDAVRVDRVTFDRVRLAILSLIVFLGILLVFDTAVDLWRSRQQAMANAEREARNLTLLLEGHAAGALGEIDLLLSTGAEYVAARPEARLPLDQETTAFLQRRLGIAPQLTAIVVLGPDGRLLQSSDPTDPAFADLSDRDYFQAHASGGGPALFLGMPGISRFKG